MNELIEAEDESFHKKIISMLNTVDSTDISLENEKLNLKSKMSNIQFQVQFNLKSANSQMVKTYYYFNTFYFKLFIYLPSL